MIQLEVLSPSYKLSAGSSVPIGARGKIHVVGKNDMAIPMTMGCTWRVKDPDGVAVEEHTDDWAGLGATDVDPNDTHEFISFLDEGFDLNKAGFWTISIWLWMNSASPVMVASYEGVLCIVEQLVGTIVKKELEYDGTKGIIPVPSVPVGQEGLVHIRGQNNTPSEQELGISWIVRDPDGLLVELYPENKDIEWSDTGAGKDHEFIGGRFEFFKEGTYTIDVKLFMNPDDPVVVDSYDGPLCTTTTEVPTAFELLEETIYPYAYIYEGPHEGGIFTFKSDPFTPASWITGRLAASCEDEIRKAGGKMLEMRVYVDKSPLLWTDWKIEVITVLPKTTAGMTTGIAWWAAAILIVLAIALIIVLTWAAKEFVGLFKRTVGLEDVKPSWGKETLIATIQDSEEYWERTPTPIATLEAMSEAELREYLDKIAEEEVPPGVSWLPWAIAGGVGVLGIGAVALLAGRKKK